MYDYGTRWSVLRQLAAEGLVILSVPPDFPAQSVRKLAPHGVFLSSGPGDPAAMSEAVSIVRELCEICPVSGIGLGYQLLGLALGECGAGPGVGPRSAASALQAWSRRCKRPA